MALWAYLHGHFAREWILEVGDTSGNPPRSVRLDFRSLRPLAEELVAAMSEVAFTTRQPYSREGTQRHNAAYARLVRARAGIYEVLYSRFLDPASGPVFSLRTPSFKDIPLGTLLLCAKPQWGGSLPYELNPYFHARDDLLSAFQKRLCPPMPKAEEVALVISSDLGEEEFLYPSLESRSDPLGHFQSASEEVAYRMATVAEYLNDLEAARLAAKQNQTRVAGLRCEDFMGLLNGSMGRTVQLVAHSPTTNGRRRLQCEDGALDLDEVFNWVSLRVAGGWRTPLESIALFSCHSLDELSRIFLQAGATHVVAAAPELETPTVARIVRTIHERALLDGTRSLQQAWIDSAALLNKERPASPQGME